MKATAVLVTNSSMSASYSFSRRPAMSTRASMNPAPAGRFDPPIRTRCHGYGRTSVFVLVRRHRYTYQSRDFLGAAHHLDSTIPAATRIPVASEINV